jgi:hypothetical protein
MDNNPMKPNINDQLCVRFIPSKDNVGKAKNPSPNSKLMIIIILAKT